MISPERLEQIIAEDIARMEANSAKSAEELGPAPAAEDDMAWIRGERDRRIAETDWTQLPDVPEATRIAWQAYRQELRDIPQNYTDPLSITWPTKP